MSTSTVNIESLKNFSKKYERLCNSLIDECSHSDMESLHASCLFIGKKILSSSHNYNSRSRISGMNFPSIHAEVGTLTKYYNQRFKKRLLQKNKSLLSVPSKTCKQSTNVRSSSPIEGKEKYCILWDS